MGVIKSGDSPFVVQPYSMKDIENTARAILLRARQKAEQTIAEAREEADNLKRQATVVGIAQGRQEGFAKGRQEGIKAGRDEAYAEQKAQLTALVSALTQGTKQLNASRRELESAA